MDDSLGSLFDPGDTDFSTPLPGTPDSPRTQWRREKALDKRPHFRHFVKMEELGGCKRSITRSLNEVKDKLEKYLEFAETCRNNKDFDRDSPEYEIVLNSIDDYLVVVKNVDTKVEKGDSLIADLDPTDEKAKSWTDYLLEKEALRSQLQQAIERLQSAARRADSRSEWKLREKMNAESAVSMKYSEVRNSCARNNETVRENTQTQLQFPSPTSQNNDSDGEDQVTPLDSNRPRGGRRANEGVNTPRMGLHGLQYSTPKLKLPENFFDVEIPPFDGTHETWDDFWDMFRPYVHDQPFDDALKLSILSKHCLPGARKFVDGAKKNGRYYQKIINDMTRHFENDYLKRNSLLKSLEEIKPARYNSESMDKALSQISGLITSLESCDNVDSGRLLRDVKAKFPFTIVMKMERKEREARHKWSMEKLLDELSEEIRMVEIEEQTRKNLQGESSSRSGVSGFKSTGNKALNSNFARDDKFTPRVSNNRTVCVFCDRNNHSSYNCRSVSVDEMRNAIRVQKLCSSCCEPGHKSFECTRKCTVCSGSHHPKLCARSGNSDNGQTAYSQNPNRFNSNSGTPNTRFPQNRNFQTSHRGNGPAGNNSNATPQRQNNYGQNSFRQ